LINLQIFIVDFGFIPNWLKEVIIELVFVEGAFGKGLQLLSCSYWPYYH